MRIMTHLDRCPILWNILFLLKTVYPLLKGPGCWYLYPDNRTALLGTFQEGLMTSGRLVTLSGLTTQQGLALPTYSRVHARPVFRYQPASRH